VIRTRPSQTSPYCVPPLPLIQGSATPVIWCRIGFNRAGDSHSCEENSVRIRLMTSLHNQIGIVLFDVGGVLVELSGVPTMLAWMGNRVSTEERWKMWLTSPVVRAFETGRSTPEIFADQLIAEMALPVGRDRLLQEFARWTLGLLPGARDLVGRVPRRYTRATLCNSNALHWPRLMRDMQLAEAFDYHFASHLMGKIKPDEEAFYHVTETLNCAAGEILFLDDNELNVEAAKRVGMNAAQVKGVRAAERVLAEAGVLDN
jgi:HAD superfamily hydrolase (TIGR01509 family)